MPEEDWPQVIGNVAIRVSIQPCVSPQQPPIQDYIVICVLCDK